MSHISAAVAGSSAGSSSSSSSRDPPPQLSLSIAEANGSTTSFKRSFEQLGLDLDEESSPKRARSDTEDEREDRAPQLPLIDVDVQMMDATPASDESPSTGAVASPPILPPLSIHRNSLGEWSTDESPTADSPAFNHPWGSSSSNNSHNNNTTPRSGPPRLPSPIPDEPGPSFQELLEEDPSTSELVYRPPPHPRIDLDLPGTATGSLYHEVFTSPGSPILPEDHVDELQRDAPEISANPRLGALSPQLPPLDVGEPVVGNLQSLPRRHPPPRLPSLHFDRDAEPVSSRPSTSRIERFVPRIPSPVAPSPVEVEDFLPPSRSGPQHMPSIPRFSFEEDDRYSLDSEVSPVDIPHSPPSMANDLDRLRQRRPYLPSFFSSNSRGTSSLSAQPIRDSGRTLSTIASAGSASSRSSSPPRPARAAPPYIPGSHALPPHNNNATRARQLSLLDDIWDHTSWAEREEGRLSPWRDFDEMDEGRSGSEGYYAQVLPSPPPRPSEMARERERNGIHRFLSTRRVVRAPTSVTEGSDSFLSRRRPRYYDHEDEDNRLGRNAYREEVDDDELLRYLSAHSARQHAQPVPQPPRRRVTLTRLEYDEDIPAPWMDRDPDEIGRSHSPLLSHLPPLGNDDGVSMGMGTRSRGVFDPPSFGRQSRHHNSYPERERADYEDFPTLSSSSDLRVSGTPSPAREDSPVFYDYPIDEGVDSVPARYSPPVRPPPRPVPAIPAVNSAPDNEPSLHREIMRDILERYPLPPGFSSHLSESSNDTGNAAPPSSSASPPTGVTGRARAWRNSLSMFGRGGSGASTGAEDGPGSNAERPSRRSSWSRLAGREAPSSSSSSMPVRPSSMGTTLPPLDSLPLPHFSSTNPHPSSTAAPFASAPRRRSPSPARPPPLPLLDLDDWLIPPPPPSGLTSPGRTTLPDFYGTLERIRSNRVSAAAGNTTRRPFGGGGSGFLGAARRGYRPRFHAPAGFGLGIELGLGLDNMGDYVPDEEFDDSYESLLDLTSAIGDVKPRKTPQHVIASLDCGFYKDFKRDGDDERCPICLDDYKTLDMVMKVTECAHWLHKGCLEHWLKDATTCPVCRHDLCPPAPTPPLPYTAPHTRPEVHLRFGLPGRDRERREPEQPGLRRHGAGVNGPPPSIFSSAAFRSVEHEPSASSSTALGNTASHRRPIAFSAARRRLRTRSSSSEGADAPSSLNTSTASHGVHLPPLSIEPNRRRMPTRVYPDDEPYVPPPRPYTGRFTGGGGLLRRSATTAGGNGRGSGESGGDRRVRGTGGGPAGGREFLPLSLEYGEWNSRLF